MSNSSFSRSFSRSTFACMLFDARVVSALTRVGELFIDGPVRCLLPLGSILWMSALKECIEPRMSTVLVETQHAVAFLGPIPDLTGGGGPCPTARMAEPLRFRQVCLALLQFLLCSLALITIRIRSIPFQNFPSSSRSGTARLKHHRYEPDAGRVRTSHSYGSPVAKAACHF